MVEFRSVMVVNISQVGHKKLFERYACSLGHSLYFGKKVPVSQTVQPKQLLILGFALGRAVKGKKPVL